MVDSTAERVTIRRGLGEDQSRTSNGNVLPFFAAAEHSRLAIMGLLLDAGADATVASSSGHTPLFVAASRGNVRACEVLIRSGGANVNTPMAVTGVTPLYIAAFNGHARVVQLLLEHEGTLVDQVEAVVGKSPLMIAVEKGHVAIVERLIQAGADVNRALAKTGTSPLHAAAEMDHATIVRLLVAAGADIDKVRAADGAAALYIAAQNGHAVIVEILIAAGVNVDKVSPRPSIAETEAPATRARRASHLSRCACPHSADTASQSMCSAESCLRVVYGS